MKKLTRNKKGFTLIEVILSVTLLAIVMVPLMTLFSSTVIISNKVKAQIELDSVVRTIFENVNDAVKHDAIIPLYDSYDSTLNDFDTSIPLNQFRIANLIVDSNSSGNREVSDKLGVIKDPIINYLEYSFDINYWDSSVDYYDSTNYPSTYNFVITVYKDNERVKTLKIAVSK